MANYNNTPTPWECQENETPKQYEAFCAYRDMKDPLDPTSTRSIRQVSEQLGKSEGLLERWSSENAWVERVTAWDNHNERIAREAAEKEMVEEIRKMRKRQARDGMRMQEIAMRALEQMDDDDFRAGDIARLMAEGSKMERTARGDVGEVIEERQGETTVPTVQFYLPDNSRDKGDDEDDL